MTSVIWSPQSLHDIESIRAYVAEDSAAYAELVVRRIVAAVEHLHTFPESGRMVPERNALDIREIIVSPYRVVYRLGQGVVVSRLHSLASAQQALQPTAADAIVSRRG